MKKLKVLTLLCLGLIYCFVSHAQGFQPPNNKNAVIYIVRTTSFGSAHTYRVFHNEEFIGVFKGKGYMRYELPAGNQLLWVASENRRFIECDLKAGETYILSSMHQPGGLKNHAVLKPITINDSSFEKCKEVILNGKEITTSNKKKAKIEEELAKKDFANSMLKKYKEDQKFTKKAKEITADMCIPLEHLSQ